MREAKIGRLLVASLHQAIGELLPTRLDFYATSIRAQRRTAAVARASGGTGCVLSVVMGRGRLADKSAVAA